MLVTNDMVSDSRVSRHAEALGRAGFTVTIVCPSSDRAPLSEDKGSYLILRVRSRLAARMTKIAARRRRNKLQPEEARFIASTNKGFVWTMRLFVRTVKLALIQWALLRQARRVHAQIYCANDLDTLHLAILAAGLDRKVVYDSHELWPDMLIGVPEYFKAILRFCEGRLIKHADAIVTVNEFIAKELAVRYSPSSQIRVIYNCPNAVTEGRRSTTRTRARHHRKIALYHGGLSPERGLENLVKAADYLEKDVLLLFRGSGAIEEELRKLASGRSNVLFKPPVKMSDVVRAAMAADVGIVPYLPTNLCNYYASPNKVFEYLQAGLPIAVSNLPFMRKVVMKNNIGTLFDARDPRSIADALNQITRPPQLAEYRRNVLRAKKRYDWKVESRKLLDLYVKLAGR